MHAAVIELALDVTGDSLGLYVIVVGVGDATKIERGSVVYGSGVSTKYTPEGTFVVSHTNVLVPVPVRPVE